MWTDRSVELVNRVYPCSCHNLRRYCFVYKFGVGCNVSGTLDGANRPASLTTESRKRARWLRRILPHPVFQARQRPAQCFLKRRRDATLRFSDALRFGRAVDAPGPAGELVQAHRPGRAWRAMKLGSRACFLDDNTLVSITIIRLRKFCALSFAKILSVCDFNSIRHCHPQAECDSTGT